MPKTAPIDTVDLQKKIFTVRGLQVMLDKDISALYKVDTKRLNEQMRRNSRRFPENFCFRLSSKEYEKIRQIHEQPQDPDSLRSQNATLKSARGKHRKYLPFVYSEPGIAMLSSILRSEAAIETSIRIINAFIAMRRFLAANALVFQRLDYLELKQADTDQKIGNILTAIEEKDISPKQGIFYDGQIFDAWQLVSAIIRQAEESIILIDNFIDETVLALFLKRKKEVSVTILSKNISRALEEDLRKFNIQYPPVVLKEFPLSHDRFLIIDRKDIYHFGASLKDLGKKWFAFTKMEIGAAEMLVRITGGKG